MMQSEIPLFQADVMQLLGIRHANTLRTWIKEGRVPQPDVKITQKTRYWHRTTLVKAGLLQASTNQPKPEA